MKTKLTEMFGIEYPIVQSGMQWLAVPQLAAAVCNAGGIGTINVTCWPTLDEFADALDEMNSLTNKPYIVNISLAPTQRLDNEEIRKTIERYGEGFAVFDQDADYQRSIAFSILQIGELSGGLSEEYRKATSSRVQWGPMKGMRNLVAHSYGSMNREIIWETAVNDIPALKQFCEEQLAEN